MFAHMHVAKKRAQYSTVNYWHYVMESLNTDTMLYSKSVQFSSVAQSCPTLCNPMNCSTPGLPVHHQFQEFTQTYVH